VRFDRKEFSGLFHQKEGAALECATLSSHNETGRNLSLLKVGQKADFQFFKQT
jgi:hypothetical protein